MLQATCPAMKVGGNNMRYYRRSGNFRVKKLLYDKFSRKKIFVGKTPYRIIVNSAR